MKILIKLPSRQRPEKLFNSVKEYLDFAVDKENINFLLSLDEDDTTITPSLLERIRVLHTNINIKIGRSENKINAINRDMNEAGDYDILLLASDDMHPIKLGYDNVIREHMVTYYPDTDGVLWFNDGYTRDTLNTLVIMGKKYYERFGFIYNPLYKSFYCDNEFTDISKKLNKCTYFPEVIIKHLHPANTSEVKPDDLYIKNNKYWADDERMYHDRKDYEYDITIMICTIAERKRIFNYLLEELNKQKSRSSLRVEIIYDNRERPVTIGEKRQSLVNLAKGKYCCFVDDDDIVSANFISIYEPMIRSENNYDCSIFRGMYVHDGKIMKPFIHSLKYNAWTEDAEGYYRCPNHLNLIKTYIAKSIRYMGINMYEDRYYSLNLTKSGLLRTEYEHNEIQYYYLFIEYRKREAEVITPTIIQKPKPSIDLPMKRTKNKIPSLISS